MGDLACSVFCSICWSSVPHGCEMVQVDLPIITRSAIRRCPRCAGARHAVHLDSAVDRMLTSILAEQNIANVSAAFIPDLASIGTCWWSHLVALPVAAGHIPPMPEPAPASSVLLARGLISSIVYRAFSGSSRPPSGRPLRSRHRVWLGALRTPRPGFERRVDRVVHAMVYDRAGGGGVQHFCTSQLPQNCRLGRRPVLALCGVFRDPSSIDLRCVMGSLSIICSRFRSFPDDSGLFRLLRPHCVWSASCIDRRRIGLITRRGRPVVISDGAEPDRDPYVVLT